MYNKKQISARKRKHFLPVVFLYGVGIVRAVLRVSVVTAAYRQAARLSDVCPVFVPSSFVCSLLLWCFCPLVSEKMRKFALGI